LVKGSLGEGKSKKTRKLFFALDWIVSRRPVGAGWAGVKPWTELPLL
jgi:hypothetical protein